MSIAYKYLELCISKLTDVVEQNHACVKGNSKLLNIRMDIIEQNQVELADDIETILLRLHSLDKHTNPSSDTEWCDAGSFNPLDDILKVMRGYR